jgi:hypothetical protein
MIAPFGKLVRLVRQHISEDRLTWQRIRQRDPKFTRKIDSGRFRRGGERSVYAAVFGTACREGHHHGIYDRDGGLHGTKPSTTPKLEHNRTGVGHTLSG